MRVRAAPLRIGCALLLALLQLPAGAVVAAAATAAERSAHAIPAMRADVLARLRKAQRVYEAGDAQAAVGVLDRIEQDYAGNRRLNSYEIANLHNFRALVHDDRGEHAAAIAAYEAVLAQPPLPPQMEARTRLRLAQLYFAARDFRRADAAYARWFALDEPAADPQSWLQHAQALYELEQYARALEVVDAGLQAAARQRQQPGEEWFVLRRALYYARGDFRMTEKVLEELAARWPRKDYIVQLSGIHGELGDRPAQVAAMELAWLAGWLTSEEELSNLAWLYLDNGRPLDAVELLSAALADGRMASTPANDELLGIAWQRARENVQAFDALAAAAARAGDAGMWLRLANLRLAEHDAAGAVHAARRALGLGGANADEARLLLGVALYRDGKPDLAREVFGAAQADARTAAAARQWLQYLDWEAAREGRPDRG